MFYQTKFGKFCLFLSAIAFLIPLLSFSFGRALTTIPFAIAIVFALLGGDIKSAFNYLKKNKFVIPLIFLPLMAYIGISYTPEIYQHTAWSIAGKYTWIALPLLLTPMLIIVYSQPKWQKIAYLFFIIGGILTALLGTLSVWFPPFLQWLMKHSAFIANNMAYHQNVASSPTMSHTETGFICAFSAFLTALLWRFEKNKILNGLYVLIFIFLSYYVLFLNTSKTGILLYIILGIVFVIQNYYKNCKTLMLAFCILVIALGSIVYLSKSSDSRLDTFVNSIQTVDQNAQDTSFGQRVLMTKFAYKMFVQSPIYGVGTGTPAKGNKDNPNDKYGVTTDPHSEFLFQLTTLGAIGLILILMYIGFMFYDSLFLIRKGIESKVALGASFAALYYLMVESALLHDPARYILAYFISLFFISNLGQKKEKPESIK